MSEIIGNGIFVGGGGGIAFVHIMFDVGDRITATSGGTTLTSDTSGDYWFVIPTVGLWTFANTQLVSATIAITYGMSQTIRLYNSLLLNSVQSNILTYNFADNYDAVTETWNDVTLNGTKDQIVYNETDDYLRFNEYVYPTYPLGANNLPATIYAVMRDSGGIGGSRGLIGLPYQNYNGEAPMFFSPDGSKLYRSTYNYDLNTELTPSDWHVLSISLDPSDTIKKAYFYVDGVRYGGNSGAGYLSYYSSGSPIIGGFAEHAYPTIADVKFFAVVSAYENESVIVANHQNIMRHYNMSA